MLARGDTAPPFSLPGTDGAEHALSAHADKPAVLVVFTCNHCPYAKAYEQRLVDLQTGFGHRGLQVLAINSNDPAKYSEDDFEHMVIRAKVAGFNFPYLHDESQDVARAYGAQCTPDPFLFDADRKLVYAGRIDDDWEDPASVTNRDLHEAIEALLSGGEVATPGGPAIGCSIKWKQV